ncbi:MAG: MBL fold metallo-hydrolase [Xanthomonadales bacterium]|nr:MBL fold metallo-hydrolase [Xanthomonadales bacterium]
MTTRFFLFCLLAFSTFANAQSGQHFQVTSLADDLLMLSTDQGSYSNNSLVFTGPDGLLLVDTHGRDDAEALKSYIDGLGFGEPKYIINTHRHVEHIGGNHVFGPGPVVVTHKLFPEKLRSGTFLFAEYPPSTFPDITFEDSMEISFNGELIRLVFIGGSHDDNEIMVYFTKHGVAHVSSVVNGFNFPSVDSDGDVLQFEPITRQLMKLLPAGTRLVSGHNGQANGFDFVGQWQQLAPYAEMMKDTVAIARDQLAQGKSRADMIEAGVFDAYQQYAGSYVSTDEWIDYVVTALTEQRESRDDICKPVYQVWKQDGADAAVALYRKLLREQPDTYDFKPYTLLAIGSQLLGNEKFADAVTFLMGSRSTYPESEYGYYTHYLAAKGLQQMGRKDEAIKQARESLRLNADFSSATELLAELNGS